MNEPEKASAWCLGTDLAGLHFELLPLGLADDERLSGAVLVHLVALRAVLPQASARKREGENL
jgi:hypothetical protein